MDKNNIIDCIGNTPLIKINKLFKNFNSNFYVKCEFMNPGGSINDRIAKKNLNKILFNCNEDIEIVTTNQDLAISYSLIASNLDIPITLNTQDYVPFEKSIYLEALGANIIGPTFRKKKYIMDHKSNKKIIDIDNISNIKNKLKDISLEIVEQFDKKIDFIFINNSMDGMVSAIGEQFRLINPNIKIIGIQSFLNEIPCVSDRGVADSWVKVSNSEMTDMLKNTIKNEGLLIGNKSALALAGAIKYMQPFDSKKYNCIIILPDSINFSIGSLIT